MIDFKGLILLDVKLHTKVTRELQVKLTLLYQEILLIYIVLSS